MADFTLECPNCQQQTVFSGLDSAPRGVLCGQCGPDNVLGEPGSSKSDASSGPPPPPPSQTSEREPITTAPPPRGAERGDAGDFTAASSEAVTIPGLDEDEV